MPLDSLPPVPKRYLPWLEELKEPRGASITAEGTAHTRDGAGGRDSCAESVADGTGRGGRPGEGGTGESMGRRLGGDLLEGEFPLSDWGGKGVTR